MDITVAISAERNQIFACVVTQKVNSKSAGRPRRSDSNVDLKAVGLRIRQLRGRTSQEEFARELGISQAQLSKYELAQSAPPLGVLVTLKELRDISVDWLLTGKKP
jgi:DNA-binding transcriptional regulator YiaG